MHKHIVLLPGDGIGPEVVSAARRVLDAVAARLDLTLTYEEHLIGGCAIDRQDTALSAETLQACQNADAVLLGAVGGPQWDNPAAPVRPEQGLLALRKGLGVFANLRPVRVYPSLVDASPLKPEKLQGVDLLVVRELTGGLYFGEPKGRFEENGHIRAVDTLEYWDYEIERILDLSFHLAQNRRGKLTLVDKANVLESSRLWRKIAMDMASRYPAVQFDVLLVDTAAMRLITHPAHFDVLVTENMFGDILTDEAAVLSGSMGLLPSASLGGTGPGLYEPIHGSAPDIAGQGIANPLGTILSVAMMLRYSFHLEEGACVVELAVERALAEGCRTRDLGGSLTTEEMTDAVLDRLVF
ncbi:3-isopropylmalate dehydrogenase [Anaerolinea sp.]|uniref:3-isopropylmalate dehydrogenase n=1 Tax=Anaerolinea sp. TaxID=1872519 RepID=UPI002604ACFD|nr:3-isopropylmalate dehydrogenase [uncultured Anaerolinea sp.]